VNEAALLAARARTQFSALLVCRVFGDTRFTRGWGRVRSNCASLPQLQKKPHASGYIALCRMPQTEVAYLMQPFGQNVLQEAAHELVGLKAYHAPSVGSAVLVAESDAGLVKARKPVVGEGRTEYVAGQISQHGFRPFAPRRRVRHPTLGPDRFGQNHPWAALGEQGFELAANELGQGWRRDQEIGVARGKPIVAANAAARHQAMNVGMIQKLLCPGMENRQNANRPAHIAGIAGKLDDGFARGFHEQRITGLLIGAERFTQLLRNCHCDMKIAARQHLGLPCSQPAFGLILMALGATAVFAGMIGIDFGAAAIAAPDVSAERFGAAGHDVGDGALVRWQHRAAMRRKVAVREAAEDIRDFDHGVSLGSEAAHQLVEEGLERAACWFDQMGITSRRRNVDMAEQNLHDAGVDAVFQEPGSITMPERNSLTT
jgi:hypothetical protein